MKSIAALLAGVLLLGFTVIACSDTIVGTDADAGAQFKKGGPPGGGDPGEWATTVSFADRVGDRIRSDTDVSYVDGECGVMAKIGNLDDMRFDPDWSYRRKDARTCGEARALAFYFDFENDPPAEATLAGAFMNIDGLCTMAVAEVRLDTYGQFNVGSPLQFEDLRAQRTNSTTWVVSTDGLSGDLATRVDGTGGLHMPFELTITALDSGACP